MIGRYENDSGLKFKDHSIHSRISFVVILGARPFVKPPPGSECQFQDHK